MNNVQLIGNLVRDPEPNGPAIKFTVAHNEKWRSKDGEENERVNYIDCVAFGKTGEIISNLSKGRRVALEGKLQYSAWEKDGQKRSKIEVNAMRAYPFPPRADAPADSKPIAKEIDSDIPF